MKKALVYGSGVSGLIISSYLLDEGYGVDVYDPYKDYKIQTLKFESGLVELAANSILYNDEVKRFLDKINLDYEFYSDLGKKKFIYLEGKPQRWPLSFWETLKNIGPLFKFGKKKPSLKPKSQETLKEWSDRVWSPTLSSKLLFPALQGVYGPDVEDLSASLIINKFLNSKKSKISGSISFKGGMSDLVEALMSHLKAHGVAFYSEKPRLQDYDFSVIATPTHSLPEHVSDKNKKTLAEVEYQEMITSTVFLKEENRLKLQGFGCVFKDRPHNLSGVILNSDIFEGRAQKGLVSETYIFDGRCLEEDEVLDKIKKIRSELFDQSGDFVESNVKKWKRAFPRYDHKLEKALESLEDEENVFYFSNWMGMIGLGSLIELAPDLLKKIKETV